MTATAYEILEFIASLPDRNSQLNGPNRGSAIIWVRQPGPSGTGTQLLLENPRAGRFAAEGAFGLQTPRRRRKAIGVLELTREVRAVGEACLVGNVSHRAVGILDQPVRVAHPQLPVKRGGRHSQMLTAKPLELPRRQAQFTGNVGDRDRPGKVLLHQE